EPWALQLPGREDRLEEDCLTEWNEALTTTVEEFEVMAAGRPLHFYGHSLGALMALDTSVRLKARGIPLGKVVMGAPPGRLRMTDSEDNGDALSRLEARYGPAPASFETPDIRDVVLPILQADLKLLAGAPTPAGIPDHLLLGTEDPSAQDAKQDYARAPVTEIAAGHYFASTHPAETVAAVLTAIR
ncbi:MAG: alpha/beta fold hydrolase, partial [Pseudomonadota bacterium]